MLGGKCRDQTGALPELDGVNVDVNEETAALLGTFIVIAKQIDPMHDVPVLS